MHARYVWPLAAVLLCLSTNAQASVIAIPEVRNMEGVLINSEEYLNGLQPNQSVGNEYLIDSVYSNPEVKQVPEPSSLLIAAMGITGWGVTRWRHRRR